MAERITVFAEGQSKGILLTSQDHIATGGEGSVYAKGGLAYKVYLDPAVAIRAGMEKKIQALAAIKHPGIAAPSAALRDKNGQFIGIALPMAKGETMCKLFTNTWRDANQFGPAETAKVVDAMREITSVAHQHRALLVDGNEMNWLVSGTSPVAIDVDSWQLPGFPGTAIMPSIRDYAHKGFTEGTDWFAWAIVTFQLWTGIHPFKGTHPDFNRAALEARMRAMASVFDSRVRLPGAVRPVADIPATLRSWYERTFSTAERTTPPSAFASAIGQQTAPALRMRQTIAGTLKIERLGSAGSKVAAAFNGLVIARDGKKLVLWDAVTRNHVPEVTEAELTAVLARTAAIVRVGAQRVVVSLEPGIALSGRVLGGTAFPALPTTAQSMWQSGNRFFALAPESANGLVELDAFEMGSRIILAVKHQWPVSVRSTQFLRGAFVQDCLGTPFVGVLEDAGVVQGAAPVLKGYGIGEGFSVGRNFVWLTALRKSDGETVRLTLAFQVDKWVLQAEEVVSDLGIDAAGTTSGVAVLSLGDDLLVAKGANSKVLSNSGLSSGMRLFSLGAGIAAFEDGEVVKVSMS
jgi:hypothetical protein